MYSWGKVHRSRGTQILEEVMGWVGFSLLGLLVLSGCSGGSPAIDEPPETSAVLQPVPVDSEDATPSSGPVVAPTRTATRAPLALTATVELGDVASYLAYARGIEGGVDVVLADPGGSGRSGYRLPVEWRGIALDLKGLSVGGEYLAYHTGDAARTPSDVTLHVIRLVDREEILSLRLMTEDVDERLLALGEELVEAPPPQLRDLFLEEMTATMIAGEGRGALESGIRSIDWSPYGGLLAFARQIDGATSDVYTFNATTGEVRRLTDGPTQVQYVDWSPDGQWIAHGSAYWVGMGTYMINNFVSRDGASVVSMDVGGQFGNEWYGSDWYLVHNGANGPGDFGLQLISLSEGTARMLWERSFSGYALHLPSGVLLVSQTEIAGGETAGTYLVDLERGSRERIEEPAFWVRRWRREGELGLMPSSDGIVAVSLDGEESLLVEGEAGLPDVSPNGSRIAFSGYGDVEGLRIVDVDSGEKTTLDVPGVTCVSWRPDSEALVFMVAGALYFNDLQGNPSVLVDAEAQESYMSYPGCNVVWIERGE